MTVPAGVKIYKGRRVTKPGKDFSFPENDKTTGAAISKAEKFHKEGKDKEKAAKAKKPKAETPTTPEKEEGKK